MRLTEKLLGYLSRVFDRGPADALAMRLRYDGTMAWSIYDGVLSTDVSGGTGAGVVLQIGGMSIGDLAAYMATQPGYSVPYLSADHAGLSALALLDGTNSQDASNGDHLRAHTSVLWSYMTAQAYELTLAKAAIAEALREMAASTASGDWVDEHGSYYGVGRRSGESDAAYAARMIGEIGRARGNGVAIAQAVKVATTADIVTVTDVTTPTVATAIDPGRSSYGLFDVLVEVLFDSNLEQAEVEANSYALIEAMRDAGTHLRKLRFARRTSLKSYVGGVLFSGHSIAVGPYVSMYPRGGPTELVAPGTVAILHFDGGLSNSAPGHTAEPWTAGTSIGFSSTSKFGANSFYGYTFQSATPFTVGTGALTADCWFNLQDADPARAAAIEVNAFDVGPSAFVTVRAGSVDFEIISSGGSPIHSALGVASAAIGVFGHLEVSRDSGGTWRVFLNGSIVYSFSDGGLDFADVSFAFSANPIDSLTLIDEARVIVGVADHTSNFSPRTTPY